MIFKHCASMASKNKLNDDEEIFADGQIKITNGIYFTFLLKDSKVF